jgi:hypothetical protein
MAATDRIADRHQRDGRPRVRDVQQDLHLGFAKAVQRGQRAAEPLRNTGQHGVLHRRVDRPTADHADAIEVGVGDGHGRRVGAEHENRRRLVQVVGKMIARSHHATPWFRHGLGESVETGEDLRGVALPFRSIDRLEPGQHIRVSGDDHLPGLRVAAGRCPTGGLKHPIDNVVGDRVGSQPANRSQGAHRVIELHGCAYFQGWGRGSRGRPRSRSPMMFRWISEVPPPMVSARLNR